MQIANLMISGGSPSPSGPSSYLSVGEDNIVRERKSFK